MARAPQLPSIDEQQRQSQDALYRQWQNIMSGFTPRTPSFQQIPTFPASYFMPQTSLNQLNRLATAQPNVNTGQIQQQASAQTELFTNPQIEALRRQIEALQALLPQVRNRISSSYRDAGQQVTQSSQEALRQALQTAQAQGGLRPGVARSLDQQTNLETYPLLRMLEAGRQSDLGQVIGALETEKRNAQEMLRTIEENKDNMTRANYNRLYDEAVARFREAQQQQISLMRGIIEIETGARSESARMAQERALAYNQYQADSASLYNQFLQQLLDTRLSGLDVMQDQMARDIQQQQEQALTQWMDYLGNSGTVASARNKLDRNRQAIIDSVGLEGYNQLRAYVDSMPPGWGMPMTDNWSLGRATPRIMPTPRRTATQAIGSQIGTAVGTINPFLGGLLNNFGSITRRPNTVIGMLPLR